MNVDLLSQNPVYADLEPIDVVEAEGALVPIMYSPDCQSSPFSLPFVLPPPPPPSAGQSLILTTSGHDAVQTRRRWATSEHSVRSRSTASERWT